MAIGILYESGEWSDYALRNNIAAMGVRADLIDTREDVDEEKLLFYRMIISRVFASSVFRGHEKALKRMDAAIALLREHNIPMLNHYDAHYYEISKELQAITLAGHGFPVPKVYGVYTPAELFQIANGQEVCYDNSGGLPKQTRIYYPCIVKPDCGGRTAFTYILTNDEELRAAAGMMPALRFIAEEYISPGYGFITRIEVIGGVCRLAVKRSVTDNGLSAYHLGSAYQIYEDCPNNIKDTATGVMNLLKIEMGSLDIIENDHGFFFIDVNAVSNVSEDNTEMFNFDLMKETAAYAVEKYRMLSA